MKGISVMAWACMAASRAGSLKFTDDATRDDGDRMKPDVFCRFTN